MSTRQSTLAIVSVVSIAMSAAVVAAVRRPSQTPQSQPPQFRMRTTVVPIDVRVLDRNGKPVTDLTAADFTVTENGVPQKIDFFAPQALSPTAPGADVTVRPTEVSTAPLAPANRRLFLIYLGRGRLQEPSKGVDATLRFVKERLLPQDLVAVMAWNRATDFSSDHTRATAVIERFKAMHEEIEHEVGLYFSGLFGLYAGIEVPPHVQTLIDRVFDTSADATTRKVLPVGTLRPVERDVTNALNAALMRADNDAWRYFNFTETAMARGMFDPTLNMSFGDYIVLNRQTMQDVGNLYVGIDFLRFIEGEKHLIFVTEQGFMLPRTEYERDLGSLASDARVAIDTIQTGGVAAAQSADGTVTVSNGFALRALREVSDISGGQSSVSKSAEIAYDRILNSTEYGYLLAYSSTDPKADGRMRNIKVTVNRKNVTVAHRRAYAARPDSGTYDPRESLATTRLVSATSYGQEINDLKMSTKLLDVKEGKEHVVNVEVTVDGSRVRLARKGADYIAALNFVVYCGDYYQKPIGELWEAKDIIVPASRFEEIKRTGLTVTLRVPVKQPPVYVKVIAYDYGSDLLGSQMKRMR